MLSASCDEVLTLPRDGYIYELLDGALIASQGCAGHGRTGAWLGGILQSYIRSHLLGDVFAASAGFRLAEDLLLSPDIAFVSRSRIKKLAPRLDKFFPGAPDLVVEVLSPSDRMTQINRKLEHYFEHGTKLAWLVNWQKEQVHIYTDEGMESLTDLDDILHGAPVLPGFKCKLRRLFGPR
jgi:Uma2 family endonuclease